MAVETQFGGAPVVKSGPYNGNGSSDTFDYDFQIQATDELLVTRQNADLTETVLTLTTDYTVDGVGDDTGGQVTLVDPANDLPTGTKLIIQYAGDYNQSTDYSNQGSIQLSELEDALDKLTMHLRQLKELTDRAITIDAFGTTDAAALSLDIGVLAAIESDLTALAAISADISTVAGIDSDVTTVAGISADVSSVASFQADITAVADISAAVSTVAGISGDVSTVASLEADIAAILAGGAVSVSGLDVSGNAVVNGQLDVASNVRHVGDTTTRIGFGTGTISLIASNAERLVAEGAGVRISGTGRLRLPNGTTAQRPGSPSAGDLRWNTTEGEFEGYDGSAWGAIGGGGGEAAFLYGWHPYDRTTEAGTEDGVFYDHSVDGTVASVETPTFEAGYDYKIVVDDIAENSGSVTDFQVEVYKDTDASYDAAVMLFDGAFGANSARVVFDVVNPKGWARENLHAEEYMASGGVPVTQAQLLLVSDGTEQTYSKMRFSWTDGSLSGGKIRLLRKKHDWGG